MRRAQCGRICACVHRAWECVSVRSRFGQRNAIGKVLNKRERTLFEDGAMGERNKTGESEISALYEPLETVGHLNVIFTITSIKA